MARENKLLRGKDSEPQELGFGKFITTQGRMMEADGSFNVERKGASPTSNVYFTLITMPFGQFMALVFAGYVLLNMCFATAYYLIGPHQLSGMAHDTIFEQWTEAFFFSTQTLTTVGYGRISPQGFGANLIASFESFIGLLSFALISGLLYGRFSRPKAHIEFSSNVLVAPFKDGKAIMIRLANKRKSELINSEAEMLLAINTTDGDHLNPIRVFRPMKLEISQIIFFSMSWTLVHHITEESPFYGLSATELAERNMEIFVLIKATEEANQQLVTSRRSYIASDIVWNARFSPMIARNQNNGKPIVMISQLSEFEQLNPGFVPV